MMRLSGEGSCIRAAPLYLSLDYWNAHSCLPTLLISNSDATQYFNGYVSKETNSVWDLVFFGIVAAKMGCKSSSTTGTKIAGTSRWQRSSQNHAKNILKYIHNVHSRARRQVAGHLVINIAPSRTKSDMNNLFSHYYILPHQCIYNLYHSQNRSLFHFSPWLPCLVAPLQSSENAFQVLEPHTAVMFGKSTAGGQIRNNAPDVLYF